MKVQSITYCNFRNIREASITFDAGANLLFGANAQGKTNALEGLFLFAQGRSFRTPHEREFVGPDGDFASATLRFESGGINRSLSMRFFRDGKKSCLVGNAPVRRMSEFVGRFRAVLFCPANLSIVRGGPGERRAFIDCALSQIDPAYLKILSSYNNILSQRNAFLVSLRDAGARPGERDADMAQVLSEQLAAAAARVSDKRDEYCRELCEAASEYLGLMSGGKEKLVLKCRRAQGEEEYLASYKANLEREIRMGTTLFGPHKDEIEIELNNMSARSYCSQGQQRSIVLAMKLSEAKISERRTGEYPVLLLDDVLSELDGARKEFLLSGLGAHQVIITTCEDESSFAYADKKIKVENGVYT